MSALGARFYLRTSSADRKRGAMEEAFRMLGREH
jgi:hypothetical protein